jgi:hypothetical protein
LRRLFVQSFFASLHDKTQDFRRQSLLSAAVGFFSNMLFLRAFELTLSI